MAEKYLMRCLHWIIKHPAIMEFQNAFTLFIRQAAPQKLILIQFNSIQPQPRNSLLQDSIFSYLLQGLLFPLFLWSFLTKTAYTMSANTSITWLLPCHLPNKHSYGIVWLITKEQKASTDSGSRTVQSSSYICNKTPSIAYCNVYRVLEVTVPC